VNDNKSDKQLILDTQRDLKNFTFLYEKYVKAVFRYAYNRSGRNREIAEDITSETFVKAIEKFQTFNFRDKPFVTWLYTIAHNLIVDHYRSKRSQNISFDSLNVQPSEQSDEIIDTLSKDELKRIVQDKAKELPDDVRNIFTLRYTESLTFGQVAKLLGKSEGSVKMKYYRGLDLLKSLIAKS